MKLILIFLLIGCANTQKSVVSELSGFSNPESVYFDPESKLTFVSNVDGEGTGKDGKGYISILSFDGKKLLNKKWIGGLNAPKGMRAKNGKLWVSDIDRVLVIEIKSAKIVKEINISGSKFLNDIAISPTGVVYVSDSIGSSIYQIDNYKSSVFAKGDHLESPNGLLYLDNKLYVAAWGLTTDWSTKVPGRLYAMNPQTKSITYVTQEPLGNLDGLEVSKTGDFLVSDWVSGKVFKVNQNGISSLIFQNEKGTADIGYVLNSNLVLVPGMQNNQVFSFKL